MGATPSSPKEDFALFSALAATRLEAHALDHIDGGENVRLFADSLQSAMAHAVLSPRPRNADGEGLEIVAGFLERIRCLATSSRRPRRRSVESYREETRAGDSMRGSQCGVYEETGSRTAAYGLA